MIDRMQKVLVLAAHADDESIGLGGTIARLRSLNIDVCVAVATDSTSTQYPGDEAMSQRRSQHLANAMKVLGVDNVVQGDFPDMALAEAGHVALNNWVSACLHEQQPDTVFVHHRNDVNLDHRALFESALVATRPTVEQCVDSVYCYYTSSSSEWGSGGMNAFQPTSFVDIDKSLETKMLAIACYADEVREFPHPRSLEAIQHLAGHVGSVVGLKAAESFQLLRSRWRAE